MKMRILLFYLISFFVLPFLSFAQMKPQIPMQVKPPIPGKTYWCAEVQDILFSKEPQQGEKLSVGVRVKFTKKTIIPGAPGQKLCDCAFEGPTGEPTKFWSKTMSLRLIGIKYSETETNLLEYYGPTPAFSPYEYSGFQVIGFVVTENDLKKGFVDVWGWSSKEPLQCRDAVIYASLAIYNQTPYNQQNECHPHSDFKKSFKPKCLPKIPEGTIEKIEKEAKIFIPPEKFLIEKRPPIKFIPFNRSYFNIPVTQDTVTLKNGKTLKVEEFLKEVNELESKLNKLGYTLRNEEPIKIKYIYPYEQVKLQKEMFSKDFLQRVRIPLPPQVVCEGYSEGHTPSEGGPRDFVPLNWDRNWSQSFGNNDFGINLTADMRIKGEENLLSVEPLFETEVSFLGYKINVLKIYKSGSTLIGESQGYRFFSQLLQGTVSRESQYDLAWNEKIKISFLDLFNVTGTLGFKGYANMQTNGKFAPSSAEESLRIGIYAKADGDVKADVKIASAGVDASLVVIDYSTNLDAVAKLVASSSPSYFNLSANGTTDKGTLLRGKLSIYAEIDLWRYTKKFEAEIFGFDGYSISSPNFSYSTSIPAEKDHHAYLKIKKIVGITPYTYRNEKLDIEPVSYDLIVDIDGNVYTKTLKDYNKSGIWGDAIGEYEDQVFEIPLLSYKKVPISIEVKEKYKIGTLEFNNTLDFAPGAWNKVELCYDPVTRSFVGTTAGQEAEEVRSVGDTSYWGERHHGILFEIAPLKFKQAPAKAK
ncbi:MAG: hypothetical protein ACK415_07950 [Thermodesulfovibrionales bacterium]